ncbi:DUF222 domain-containing protein [Microbacterium sp. Mu-80]|uniref:DUF222 domain-containing protein n=1 Tax=Microbacterium bandirmense TaxID=3122050 RepID=A0ABU8L5X4_9MICO
MASSITDRLEQQSALLDEWLEVRREINRAEARAAALLAERAVLMDADVAEQPQHREAIERSMVAEFSAAGNIARGTVERAVSDARFLATGEYPALSASYAAGMVSAAHVREILHAASPVREAVAAGTADPDALDVYDSAAVVFAESESPARTRVHAREVAAALAGSTITDRHERARSERTVTVRSVGDGLALLQVILPEHLALAIHDRLTQMARHQKQHGEDREPTLPLDEDALQDKLDNDPRHYGPENDTGTGTGTGDATFSGSGTGSSSGSSTGSSSDSEGAHSGETIFGAGDTFTRDPFTTGPGSDPFYTGLGDDGTEYVNGVRVPPDDDPFHGDPDAYWAHVEAMITAGPQVIHLPTDERTLDQIRADLLTDLLLTATPTEVHGTGLENITARIQVTVAATTLTGADNKPAQLDGHGELHPDIARSLAGRNTGWTRLFLDPTGMVTETDTYTPTEPMRRFLRARDQHCRFPGCRMPVHRSEIDHTHDHAHGGPTATDNLAHLCKTHHALKHPDIDDQHRWTARQLPNWDLQWTSPAGRIHTETPPRRVMFVPSGPLSSESPTIPAWTTAPAGSDAPF